MIEEIPRGGTGRIDDDGWIHGGGCVQDLFHRPGARPAVAENRDSRVGTCLGQVAPRYHSPEIHDRIATRRRIAPKAEVAIVKPLSLEIWQTLTDDPASVAAWEDAKWTYTALAHAHLPITSRDLHDLRHAYGSLMVAARAARARCRLGVVAGGARLGEGLRRRHPIATRAP